MPSLVEFFINATALSAMYALVAIGFTLIFGVGNVLNFAHGALLTVGAYTAFLVTDLLPTGPGPWLGILAGTAVAGAVGALLYATVVTRVRERPVTVLLVTLLVGFVIRHAVRVGYGAGHFTIVKPIPGQSQILGYSIIHHRLFVFIVSWLAVFAVVGLVNYTRTGKAILATSMSHRGAAICGIDGNRINLYTWALAAGLAGLAGVLLGGFQTGAWDMGLQPMVLSFSIVILGGLGSIRGSIAGAYIIGFLETSTTTFISTRLTGVAALLLLILVLLVRPSGLYGREVPT